MAEEEKKPAAKKPAAKKTTTTKKATAAKDKPASTEEKKVKITVTTKKSTPKKPAAKKPAAKVEEKVTEEKKPAVKKASAKKAGSGNKKPTYTSRVKEDYLNRIVPELMKEFGYKSVMEAPRLEKIVINMGVGEATDDSKHLEAAINDLTALSGQHPVKTKAKKSVANFKVREGQAIGCKVTLRSLRMYDFFDKLVTIALPRVRDFRGLSKNSFDGRGNYALGVKEQLIFPEIDYDKIGGKVRGMDIIIVTTAKTDKEAFALLQLLGMPFRR